MRSGAGRAADPPLEGVEPAGSKRHPHPPTTALGASSARCPPKQRAAVVHRFVFDLAYAEIGERMGTSEEAARQNVERRAAAAAATVMTDDR